MNQAVPLNESLAAGANGAAKLAVIRVWLWLVAALIFLMVIVGGATRLTESGLSIVEWKPVTGTLPPLNETQWNDAFSAYKQIPQYRQMNEGMTLPEFKTIFWWEWTHRLLGRVIGAAYLLPFLFFLWRGWIAPALKPRLWFIFGLGAFQGAVGWWMVASGLADRVSVSQYRLSAHLLLATLIFGAIVWTAQTIGREGRAQAPGIVRLRAVGLVIALYLQLYLGALVAGLRAGLVYNTWPLMDGALIPSSDRLWFATPWWRNLFESALTAQFDHRMLAYAIFAVALWHAADVVRRRIGSTVLNGALILASVVTAQAALGIITLIHQVPLALGLMHQAGAMVALTVALLHAGSMYKGLTAKRGRAAPVAMPS